MYLIATRICKFSSYCLEHCRKIRNFHLTQRCGFFSKIQKTERLNNSIRIVMYRIKLENIINYKQHQRYVKSTFAYLPLLLLLLLLLFNVLQEFLLFRNCSQKCLHKKEIVFLVFLCMWKRKLNKIRNLPSWLLTALAPGNQRDLMQYSVFSLSQVAFYLILMQEHSNSFPLQSCASSCSCILQ